VQARQLRFYARCLDLLERHPLHSRDARILASPRVGMAKDGSCDLRPDRSSRLPALPFQRATPNTPMDRTGAPCRFLPRPRGLALISGGSASMTSVSMPAQASLTLRPAGSLNRLKAVFVTWLQPSRLPDQTARQLPGPSTTSWVDPSSTDNTRRRSALRNAG
jgi:hypothetical protein